MRAEAMKKIFRSGTLVLVAAGLSACSSSAKPGGENAKGRPVKNRNFEIQGHRGARWVRPENTLSAFRYALAAGVDTLEMDLLVTKDGVLVVAHDPVLNPDICLDPKGRRLTKSVAVRSLTLKQLKRYDCGTLVNPRFPMQAPQPKERIPTLEEVLVWLANDPNPRAKTVLLNLETKSEEAHPEFAPSPKVFAKLVLDMMKKHGVLDRSTLQSFDFRTLVAARALEPKVMISALIEDRPKEPLVEIAARLKANVVSPNHEWLTAEDVMSLQAAQVKVIPWTVNAKADWERLVSFGVDGMISDHPQALLEYRQSLGGRSSLELEGC
jgi:glycerophosphoryl diester phosphodiesterase